MKINFKNSVPLTTNDVNVSWKQLAEQAASLSFDDNQELNPSKKHNYSSSKALLEKSIKTCDLAWPFIMYAEFFEDNQQKIDIYEKSFAIEKTDFAIVRIVYLNILLNNLENAKKWFKELISLDSKNYYINMFNFLEETFLGKDKQLYCSLIPYDFDPQFYLEAHEELSLRSKLQAIFHFIEHGKKELRDYKRPIEAPIVKCDLNDIVLFTQYYACDEETQKNIIYCLDKNISNNLVKEIIIFYDQEEIKDELIGISKISKKIRMIKISKRLTFKEWFEFSKKNYPKSIKVLANSDIYFDNTLSFLYNLEYRKDIFYSCSRLDLSSDNKLVKSRIDNGDNSPLINNYTSQDCWVFRDDLIPFDSDFMLGYENCDVFLKHNCLSAGCNFLNIFKYINCIHVDRRKVKVRAKYEFTNDQKNDWLSLSAQAEDEPEKTKAIELFRKAIQLKPGASWPFIKLASLLDGTEEKIDILLEGIRIGDNNPWGYILLIQCLIKQGNQKEAKHFLLILEEKVDKDVPLLVTEKIAEIKISLGKAQSKILLRVHGDLARRLKTLNSFYSLATSNNKKLLVCWSQGFNYNDQPFNNLFEENHKVSFVSNEEFEEMSKGFWDLNFWVNPSLDGKGFKYDASKEEILLNLKQSNIVYFGDDTLEDMIEDISFPNNDFYLQLEPRFSLEHTKEIEKIVNNFKENTTIGVCCQKEEFSSLLEQVDKEIALDPNVNFFLYSESNFIQKALVEKYGDRILYQKDKSAAHVAADIFLLASTSKIICSNNSVIGEISSKIANLPLTKINLKNQPQVIILKPKTLLVNQQVDWQFPASTEKQAFINHENNYLCPRDKIYVGCPWASIIDYISHGLQGSAYLDFYKVEHIREYFNQIPMIQNDVLEHETHTVCQHIYWYKMIGFWKHIGIKNIYVSHLTKEFKAPEGIKFHPWHLIGCNMENPKRNNGLWNKPLKERTYLCSFVGSNTNKNRSDIRLKIKKLFSTFKKNEIKKDVFFNLNKNWFYSDLVYKNQLMGKGLNRAHLEEDHFNTLNYNKVLSDSVFSLCPEGTGPNTIRLWESMAVGTVPVLFENDWERPKVNGFDWDDFSITLKSNQFDNLFYILNEIPHEIIEEMRIKCINFYNAIRTKTCF